MVLHPPANPSNRILQRPRCIRRDQDSHCRWDDLVGNGPRLPCPEWARGGLSINFDVSPRMKLMLELASIPASVHGRAWPDSILDGSVVC
ncbi:hypothetical protein JMJ77_0001420 [Colletotrichum scovillei]|uniref:Uncharacterized protein n=1 Tax=Colletotrichum scovillei TaxID=1209932 RepID=A0A9P7UF27_9PEZI|nr:hypothetical protein JMJ77_0001420 [Colletotrichum scovillei]KAG7072644.1 hypothetical protein JMJ76_0005491 [Colletotrichum scovillei]KAG7080944.1 hypothetical protein JMJ78_0008027 [Colletotrichum scovillei]